MKFNWFWQAVISMVFFSAVTLLFKVLVDTKLKPEVINFYFFLFTALGFLPIKLLRGNCIRKKELNSNNTEMIEIVGFLKR